MVVDDLSYDQIEEQLVDALPELAPAAECYWRTEGAPGSDCGAYIFFEDLFACYVEILLVMPSSSRRDELLRRAFGFVDLMCASSDLEVCNLAFVGLLEWREEWLYSRSRPFLGPATCAVLDRWSPQWRSMSDERVVASNDEFLDGWGVRGVIAQELRTDGITMEQVPGRTYEQTS
jgi:hypothetical protein